MKTIGAVLGSLAIGKLIKDSTQMAMGVETAIENINHNMGQAAKAFQDWVETQSKSFGMAKADAYSYGSIFSNLLSSFTSSAEETAKQTQELMKAAAIIASRTGRTYEDVANRIRSGMLGSTEAIEDLGVYTNISVLQSTEAFRRLAGDKSWAQLDYRTQQQIRLAAILEQTYKRYGDTLADTTQTRQAQFVASLKNIQLSLGQAFLPIYNAVLPALTTMANAIGRVVNLIAQFTTALFGAPKQAQAQATAIQSQASAMQDLGAATKKAAKEAKGALAGFDEIHQLAKQSKADAGGSGGEVGGIGTTAVPSLDTGGFASATIEVSEKVQEMANEIKKAFEDITNTIKANKAEILTASAGLGAGIATYLIGTHWTQIITAVIKAKTAIVTAFSAINAPMLAVVAIVGLVVAAIVDLWQKNEEFRNAVTEAWNGIKDTLSNIWETILKPIFDAFVGMLMDIWNNGLKPLWDKWEEFVKQRVLLMTDLWNGMKPVVDWVVETFGPAIVEVFKYVFNNFKNNVMLIIDVVGSLLSSFTGIVNGIRQIFKGLIDFIVGVFTGDWSRAWDGIKQIFSGVGTAISSIWNGIKDVFGAILSYVGNTFRATWESAWNIIKSVAINIWNGLSSWLSTLWNNLKNTAANIFNNLKNAIVSAFNSIKSSTSSIWNSIWSTMGTLWNNLKNTAANTFNNIKNSIVSAFNSIKSSTTSIWNSIWSTIKGVLNWIIGGMNKMINALNGLRITVPGINIPLVGKVGGFTIGLPRIPTIPLLAQGGIVTSPTLAMIGEAGPEAVVPLTGNNALMQAIKQAVYEALLAAISTARTSGANNGNKEIVLVINGREVARGIVEDLADISKKLGIKFA